jgi:hypothetical protein
LNSGWFSFSSMTRWLSRADDKAAVSVCSRMPFVRASALTPSSQAAN